MDTCREEKCGTEYPQYKKETREVEVWQGRDPDSKRHENNGN